MLDEKVFYVRPDDLVHDTIEGETVVIDLLRGIYFRFDGAATQAWNILLGRTTEGALIDRLAASYAAPREAIAGQVHGFLIALYGDGIICRTDDSDTETDHEPAEAGPMASDALREGFAGLALDRFDELRGMAGNSTPLRPFDRMVLNRFEDLDELLMIDPVHEVRETGWPHRQDVD